MTPTDLLDKKMERLANRLEQYPEEITHEELVDGVAVLLRRLLIAIRQREYEENVPLRERFPDGTEVNVLGGIGGIKRTVCWPRFIPASKQGQVPVLRRGKDGVVWWDEKELTICNEPEPNAKPVTLKLEAENGAVIEVTLAGVRRVIA